MTSTLLGIFLLGHAIAHAGLAAAPIPGDPDPKPGAFFTVPSRSWLFMKLNLDPAFVRWIGIILVIISCLGFVIAGLGGLGTPGLRSIWQGTAGITAVISLILLVLFWHPWLILGVVIDVGLLVLLFINSWPS
jgi:hypothetical protein